MPHSNTLIRRNSLLGHLIALPPWFSERPVESYNRFSGAEYSHKEAQNSRMFGCTIWCFMIRGIKIWLGVGVALVACSKTPAGVPPTGSALEKTHLTIGVAVPAATYLPLYVAVDEGTFAKQGLRADLVEFRGGTDLIPAIGSKYLDVGGGSLAQITFGVEAGQALEAFYGRFKNPALDLECASFIKKP